MLASVREQVSLSGADGGSLCRSAREHRSSPFDATGTGSCGQRVTAPPYADTILHRTVSISRS
jgi:hypothetical protein